MTMTDERDYSDVLIGGVEKVEIRIVDYDPTWPGRFQDHAAKIRAALGDTALRIEQARPLYPAFPPNPLSTFY